MTTKVPERPSRASPPQKRAGESIWWGFSESTRKSFAERGLGPESFAPPQARDAQPRVSPATQLMRERAEQRADRRQLQQQKRRDKAVTHAAQRAWARLTPREKRIDRAMKRGERDRVRLQRARARMQGNHPDHAPPELANLPRSVYIMARDVMCDPTGAAARTWFARCRNKVAIGLLRRAALVPDESGKTRYTWADSRARAIAALGLALLELATPTPNRPGAWASVVKGYQRSILCALLENPHEPGRRPHVNTLAGRHRVGATYESGQVGWLVALEDVGFLYSQQLPAAEVEPYERFRVWRSDGADMRASNRYWLITDSPTEPRDDDDKRRLVAAHTEGLELAGERPQRQARTARERRALLEALSPRAAPS